MICSGIIIWHHTITHRSWVIIGSYLVATILYSCNGLVYAYTVMLFTISGIVLSAPASKGISISTLCLSSCNHTSI